MKTFKNHNKLMAVILIFSLLFQGCTVYKSRNIPLDQATKIVNKVKVEYYSGDKQKFKRIIEENDMFYGIKMKKGQYKKVLLNLDTVKRIQEKDKTASTILTIALPIGIIAGVILAFQDSFKWKNNDIRPLDFDN